MKEKFNLTASLLSVSDLKDRVDMYTGPPTVKPLGVSAWV